jgi:hypothetical protein
MIIHDFLPILIAFFGLFSGVYTIQKAYSPKITADKTLQVNFILLGMLNLYIGAVYIGVLTNLISAVPAAELSIYMRPANLLQIVLPFFISWRMGL